MWPGLFRLAQGGIWPGAAPGAGRAAPDPGSPRAIAAMSARQSTFAVRSAGPNFPSLRASTERVHRHLARFIVNLQLESILEHRPQHQIHGGRGSVCAWKVALHVEAAFGVHVESIGRNPARAADDLARICGPNHFHQCDARLRKVARLKRPASNGVHGFVRLDRDDVEHGAGGEDTGRDKRDEGDERRRARGNQLQPIQRSHPSTSRNAPRQLRSSHTMPDWPLTSGTRVTLSAAKSEITNWPAGCAASLPQASRCS